MNYWEGNMWWPITEGWKCEICGKNDGLTWGLVHGVCRCNNCHTQYNMRDFDREDNPVMETPICRLKSEYKEPLKLAYQKYQVPITKMSDEIIDEFMTIQT